MQDLEAVKLQLRSLALLRGLLCDEVFSAFLSLAPADAPEASRAESVARFCGALFAVTDDLADYVRIKMLEDENVVVRRAAEGTLKESYREALRAELDALQAFAGVTPEDAAAYTNAPLPFPRWQNSAPDLGEIYRDQLMNIGKRGYGVWAKYRMFVLKDGQISPVKHPDEQRLSDFSGYRRERSLVIANTEALLAGKPCNNVLLYGDAGAGKSSTVKAIVNEYWTEGLRLIEVKKNELFFLPDILDRLARNPLKFIIFIDDLSFTRSDSDFGALKAILEGSVAGRSRNIAVYATSNRRHLVQESISDRSGDDLHRQDTIQELTSLSARFGLQVTFLKPDKKLFAQIVLDLARQHGVTLAKDELLRKAEAFALRGGGRSPRLAKQFIEYIAYSEKNAGASENI